MPTFLAVIQFTTDDLTIRDGIFSDLTTAIDSWPESVNVSQATITDDTGAVTDLIEYTEETPPTPPATEPASDAPATDPNTDPNQSLPTGQEF